jgi:hypothetical protein
MNKPKINFACWNCDRTRALMNGRVSQERLGTPEQLVQHINEDRKNWQRVLDQLTIKPE